MKGRVLDVDWKSLAGAIVDVSRTNTGGTYSYLDPSQLDFNLRLRIVTDAKAGIASAVSCHPDTAA